MLNMRIGVTGATGFVGRRLVKRLVSEKHSVKALVHNSKADLGGDVNAVTGDLVTGEGESFRDMRRRK